MSPGSQPRKASAVRSMTGFCSVEGRIGDQDYRLEIKSLNHRHLDLKLRIPKELSAHEMALRQLVQSRLSRGALELKLERSTENAASPSVSLDLELAKSYHQALLAMQSALGLKDVITTREISALPDVLTRAQSTTGSEQTWKQLESLIDRGITKLTEMREHEGTHLASALLGALDEMTAAGKRVADRREECRASYPDRIQERIRAVFEAYPMAQESAQAVLETRVAQELALLLDRTDVQEELTRFEGHLGHFRKVIEGGGPVGRKLDFILQEMHREVNTLGNKAQDLAISEEIVQLKVRLEQIREQVMNLE